jgi:hypothetical protein
VRRVAEPGPAVAGADAGAAPPSSAAASAAVAAAASAAASAASAASAAAAFPGGSCLPGVRRFARLANGLTVCVVENHQAPVVTTALSFRAGTRDEPPGHGGVAHFLEHMMFKGSARFGPGEIDRRTQALGGSNNAFTSHDSTTYYFSFAADRWTEALAIESDRIAALTLDPRQVASERQVIREEIAMYESEPWDALEVAVQARLFRGHPYGRPVLGTRGELRATGREDLASFQRRFYRPDNAVLVVAGQTAEEAVLAQVERFMGGLEPGAERRPRPRLLRARRRGWRGCAATRARWRACCLHCRRRRATIPTTRCCACWWRCSAVAAPAGCTARWWTRDSSAAGCRPT